MICLQSSVLARCRENRRIVAIISFGDFVEEPRRGFGYGESRPTITEDGLAGDVFENRLALAHVLEKCIRSHGVDQAMSVPVGSDLMAAIMRLTHEMRKAFGDVTQEKAGNARVLFAENV